MWESFKLSAPGQLYWLSSNNCQWFVPPVRKPKTACPSFFVCDRFLMIIRSTILLSQDNGEYTLASLSLYPSLRRRDFTCFQVSLFCGLQQRQQKKTLPKSFFFVFFSLHITGSTLLRLLMLSDVAAPSIYFCKIPDNRLNDKTQGRQTSLPVEHQKNSSFYNWLI